LSEPLIYLILLIHMKWVDMLVRCGHIWFIVHFWFYRFFAGYFWVFWCNSLIINGIPICRLQAIAGNFCGGVGHTLGSVGGCGKVCCDALGNCILT
jgi:hypothetical protein